jgi:hypothetical protein
MVSSASSRQRWFVQGITDVAARKTVAVAARTATT